jgi:hypothetical protein
MNHTIVDTFGKYVAGLSREDGMQAIQKVVEAYLDKYPGSVYCASGKISEMDRLNNLLRIVVGVLQDVDPIGSVTYMFITLGMFSEIIVRTFSDPKVCDQCNPVLVVYLEKLRLVQSILVELDALTGLNDLFSSLKDDPGEEANEAESKDSTIS